MDQNAQYSFNGNPISSDVYQKLFQIGTLSKMGVPDNYLYPLLQDTLTPKDPYEEEMKQIEKRSKIIDQYNALMEGGQDDVALSLLKNAGLPVDTSQPTVKLTDFPTVEAYQQAQTLKNRPVTEAQAAEFMQYQPDIWKSLLSTTSYTPEDLTALIPLVGPAIQQGIKWNKLQEEQLKQRYGGNYEALKAYKGLYETPGGSEYLGTGTFPLISTQQ